LFLLIKKDGRIKKPSICPSKSSEKPAVADVEIELMKANVNPIVSCFIVLPCQKNRGN